MRLKSVGAGQNPQIRSWSSAGKPRKFLKVDGEWVSAGRWMYAVKGMAGVLHE